MPRARPTREQVVNRAIEANPNNGLIHGSNKQCPHILWCGPCRISIECVGADNKSRLDYVTKHITSDKHQDRLAEICVIDEQDEAEVVSSETRSSDTQSKFDMDIARLFVATGTPFHRLLHPIWSSFINTWVNNMVVKHPKSYFRTHLPKIYERELAKIREEIGDQHILVTVDETTDAIQRSVINVLVGKLSDEPSLSKLIYVGFEDDNLTGEDVRDHVMVALEVLWPYGIRYNQVHGLLSDGAAYMVGKNKGAGTLLKKEFHNLVHITCVVHALHNLCKFAIQKVYTKPEKLASLLTQVLCRSKERRESWKYITGLQVPNSAIETRFCSILNYTIMIHENWNNICKFVDAIGPEGDKEKKVKELKHMLFDPIESGFALSQLQKLLHLEFLSEKIVRMQSERLHVDRALRHLNDVKLCLSNLVKEDKIDPSIYEYYTKIMDKNNGLSSMLHNEHKYFPLNTMSVERSFSLYKETFTPRRHRTKEATLEMLMVVRYNNFVHKNHDDDDDCEID